MFSGASGTPSSWTEQSFLLTPYFTTDGGNTLTPSVLYAGSWTSGGDYLYTDAAVGGNWVVITKGTGLTFTPNSFQIAQRSGTHTLISSTGAEVTVTGGVGDTFTFPVTVDWANLSSLTLYSESGDLGFDTFIFSLCPDPYIIGNVTVDEGSGLTLYASTEGLSPTYSWDLDGDGQYNDATGDTVLFNASALDGPSTVEVGLEVEADCGVAGVLTMATSRTISILNVEPSITSFGGDSSGAEGSSLSWSAAVSDPAAADTVSTSWDFGDGSPPVTGGLSQSYSYADNGTYSVTITATDDDGDSASDTLAVSVANALPTVSVTSLPDGDEGESLSFEASVSDPGTADILTTTWDFGDGSPNGTGTTVTHSYADNGSYTVTTTVEDDDGGTIATSGSVTIDNVSPSLTQTSIPSSGDEGETLNFEATATDPGNDTITTSWDFGDGSPTVQGTPTDHSWADEGSYTLVLTVSDEDGGSEELQSTITISNLAPSIGTFAVPSGVEGEVLNFAASATDPGSDTLSFLWNFGDGSPSVTAAQTTHVFDDEGSYTVSLTVSDGDGGTDTASGSSVLTNAAPSIDSLTGNTTGLEGQTLSWTAVVTDPGAADSVTVEWTFGDASSPATGSSVSHAYPDEGTFVITAVASDNDGASTTAYLTVTVSNDGPSITSMTVPAGQEGSPVSVSAEATDPGGDVLTYSWDFGDGSPATSGQSLSHTYDDDGTYVVQVTATDPVGASSSLSTAAVIANVAPSIDSLSAPSSGLEGESLSFSATASDPSAADTITLSFSWDFGDGSEPASGSTATHTYDDDGTFTVTLTVGDGDGSTAQSTAALTVANAAPTLLTTPGTTATEGSLYAYDGYATDPGADLLNWSLSTAPTGMTVHSVTGLVNWTPTLSQSLEGDHAVTLVVDDGDGGSSEQSWTIAVSFLDDDADEMADGWELDYGLDPSDPNDATLDPDNDGWTNLDEFLQGASPLSFDGPGAPTPTSPLDEEVETTSPALIVINPSDPQTDPLSIYFEAYADSSMTQLIEASEAVDEDLSGSTEWTPTSPLTENTWVYWRAQAADPYTVGDWSELVVFFVNEANDAPPAPSPTYPILGEFVAKSPPTLQWVGGSDPDGDPTSFRAWLNDETGLLEEASDLDEPTSEDDPPETATYTWTPTTSLVEDQSYSWAVAAVDEHGLEGPTSTEASFLYTASNGAPEGVEFLSPETGAIFEEELDPLVLSEGSDPEGEELEYLVEIDSIPELGGEDYQSASLSGSGTGTVSWDLGETGLPLPENGWLYARVRGIDPEGLSSVPHTISLYFRGPNDPPSTPQLLGPEDGAEVDGELELWAGGAGDPEGDTIHYGWVLCADAELTLILDEGTSEAGVDPEDADSSARWTPTEHLEVGDLAYWSAQAIDERGQASDWATPHSIRKTAPATPPNSSETEGACSCEDATALGLLPLLLVPCRRRRRNQGSLA